MIALNYHDTSGACVQNAWCCTALRCDLPFIRRSRLAAVPPARTWTKFDRCRPAASGCRLPSTGTRTGAPRSRRGRRRVRPTSGLRPSAWQQRRQTVIGMRACSFVQRHIITIEAARARHCFSFADLHLMSSYSFPAPRKETWPVRVDWR